MDAPAPILRLKRKRDEEGADLLLLEVTAELQQPNSKRRAVEDALVAAFGGIQVADGAASASAAAAQHAERTGAADGEAAAAADTVPKRKFRFRRVGSTQQAGSITLRTAREMLPSYKGTNLAARTVSHFASRSAQRTRAARAEAMKPTAQGGAGAARPDSDNGDDADSDDSGESHPLRRLFQVVDIVQPARPATSAGKAATGDGAADSDDDEEEGVELVRRMPVKRDPAHVAARCTFIPLLKPIKAKVLNPMQRRMDEAVWMAWVHANFQAVFAALAFGCNINYQRAQSDLSTALMAAAHHGNSKVAASLVRQGALARIPDASGRTAVQFAADAGHAELSSRLKSVLMDEMDEIATWSQAAAAAAEHTGGAEDEYDMYVLEPDDAGEAGGTAATTAVQSAGGNTRTIRVAAASAGALHTFINPEADDDEAEWVFWQEDAADSDADSEDSNAEDAEGNEYPDELSGDEEDGNDEDDRDSLAAMRKHQRTAGVPEEGEYASDSD